VQSVCPHCTDGCSFFLNLRGDRLVNVLADVAAPHNQGQLCVRGQFGYDFPNATDRLMAPLMRRSTELELLPVTWDDALDGVADGLAHIRKQHGGQAIGVISSGHCSNEENYLVQKFARTVVGTNNIDQPGRLDYAPTVTALLDAFGCAAATNPISDLALAGCLLVVGSATVESHEITALRIKKAVRNGAKLIVIDPRHTSLDRFAYLHLQPRPGSDLALLNGLLNVIVCEGLYDADFVAQRCEGFDELVAMVREYSPERASELTGVLAQDIQVAARVFATGGADPRYTMPVSWLGTIVDPGATPGSTASSIVFGSGVTQQRQAVASVHALANLAMVTGNLGRAGGGLYPRVGQHNIQGAVDMGAWPDLLPGYRRVADGASIAYFAERWAVDLPVAPGLTMLEMFERAHQGRLKALYVIGANPLLTLPDQAYLREALAKLDLLVVQELFPSELTARAHVVLPAASYAEKDGTYTNGERRVQLARAAITPVGDSRPDWVIVADLARRLASRLGVSGAVFNYPDPAAIMAEIAALVPSYSGISYNRLGDGGVQWPCIDAADAGTDVLYVEGFDRGRGKLVAAHHVDLPPGDAAFPLQLIVGREIYHTNTGAMTRRAQAIGKFRREAHLELHPDEVAWRGLEPGALVRVRSAHGEISARVKPNASVPRGQVFLPVHYAECPAYSLFPRPDAGAHPQLKTVAVTLASAHDPSP
jgi:predicted molibdopterin-dependent oxidoreductase YjgC